MNILYFKIKFQLPIINHVNKNNVQMQYISVKQGGSSVKKRLVLRFLEKKE